MEFASWNRAAVLLLIQGECGITLSVRGVGGYLKRGASRRKSPSGARMSNAPRQ